MKKIIHILLFLVILSQGSANVAIADLSDFVKLEINDQMKKEYIKRVNPIKSDSIIYSENQRAISAINPQKQDNITNYYPGFRGPNQLIIYTPKYGDKTGTNEFGTEAIVKNGMVVALNGANSTIPFNGYVISGHGKAKTWIIQNLQVGTYVYIDYDNNVLRCYLTQDSLLYATQERIKEVSYLLNYYRNNNFIYPDKVAGECLEEAKKLVNKAQEKPEKTKIYVNSAMELLDKAMKNVIPYIKSELKGIWVRPVEKTPEEIEQSVQKMYETGITDIFLETYYHGKTIFNSSILKKYGVLSQRDEFKGFDPLSIWIKEAHKRKMKVHVWFECFYVGNDKPQNNPNHILSVYPYWSNKRFINYDSEEPVVSKSEHNGYFLDPSNGEVQEFLLEILAEIIEKYKIDGINLDYIRYPQTVESSSPGYSATNWGYTENARREFELVYGVDPINVQYGSMEWEFWSLYRQNKIAEFVRNVKQLTKHKDIKLTAVIFPDLNKSIETKMQNWKLWAEYNYVDGFTPLLLTGDKNTAVNLLREVRNNVSSSTEIYPGIFVTFMDGTFEDLLWQIHKTREFNSKGAIIFDYAHFGEVYQNALKTRIYNEAYEEKKKEKEKEKEKEKADKKSKFRNPSSDASYKPEVKYKDNKRKLWRKNK